MRINEQSESSHTFTSGGTQRSGTMTWPEGETPFPVALLIAGSGPLDRNGDHKRLPLGIQRELARLLAEQGWASFRYDKRGVGASEGDYHSAGLSDELQESRDALALVRSLGAHGKIVVIGHSAGSLHAAELATSEPDLAGAVLLSGTAHTGEETLVWQAGQVEAHALPAVATFLMKVLRKSVTTEQQKTLAKLKATTKDVVRIQGIKVNAKWMREFMAYDPAIALGQIEIPTLAITGDKDIQVDVNDLVLIEQLAGKYATTVAAKDVSHILREELEEHSNPQRYKKQAKLPLADAVVKLLLEWLTALR